VVALLPETIVSAYTTDPALVVLAVPAMALSALFFVADGLQVVAANALRARDDVWLPTLTHTISYAGVMLPLGYVLALPLGMGLIGLVWSVVIASVISAGFLLARFWWLSRRSFGPKAEALQSLA
jgi:MATE family multidrug resistance protein